MNHASTLGMITLILLSSSAQAQWTADPDVPTAPFDGGYAFALAGKVYVGAGDALYAYDPAVGSWQPRAAFPGDGDDRGWATSFVIGNTAYVGLGITTGNVFRTDLHAYDPVANAWTQKAAFPGTARGGASAFVVDGKAYVCGGTSTGPTFSDVYRYDPVANAWAMVSTLPTGTRGFTTAFAIGDYGYVYGGYYGFGNETPQLHRYDPANGNWTQMASFPGGGRQSAVAVVIDGKALVGMGHSGFITGYQDFFSYDPTTNAWAPAGSFPGGERICPVAAALGGTMYLGTGYDLDFGPNNDWWSNAGLVGLQENSADDRTLQLFPVPSDDAVSISFGGFAEGWITVCDITGSTVVQQPVRGMSTVVDLSGATAGLYTVRFNGTDGSVRAARAIRK